MSKTQLRLIEDDEFVEKIIKEKCSWFEKIIIKIARKNKRLRCVIMMFVPIEMIIESSKITIQGVRYKGKTYWNRLNRKNPYLLKRNKFKQTENDG